MYLLPRMPTWSLTAARRAGVLARHMASTSPSSGVPDEVTTPSLALFLLLNSELLATCQIRRTPRGTEIHTQPARKAQCSQRANAGRVGFSG